MKVGVLAVQGAFAEMSAYWRSQGAETFEIRQHSDLEHHMDMLALPGGESTVQGKLLNDLELFEPLKARIAAGLPVFAVCAGLILLSDWFQVLPVMVKRNAYGRQLGSFTTIGTWNGHPGTRMTFIRAPAIMSTAPDVEILSSFNGQPSSVKWRNITAFTWHPELN